MRREQARVLRVEVIEAVRDGVAYLLVPEGLVVDEPLHVPEQLAPRQQARAARVPDLDELSRTHLGLLEQRMHLTPQPRLVPRLRAAVVDPPTEREGAGDLLALLAAADGAPA